MLLAMVVSTWPVATWLTFTCSARASSKESAAGHSCDRRRMASAEVAMAYSGMSRAHGALKKGSVEDLESPFTCEQGFQALWAAPERFQDEILWISGDSVH